MAQLFADGARANLASTINSTDTSLTISSGGSDFPVANTGTSAIGPTKNWFKLVLQDASGIEIVYVRTHTSGSNTFSNLLRGQEGTTAVGFTSPAAVIPVVGLRMTAQNAADWDAKEPAITPDTTAKYWRGDKSWQDLATSVRAAVLTGLTTATGTAVTATDTVLAAFGKLQKQITTNLSTLSSHTSDTNNPHAVVKADVGLGAVDNVSASSLRDRATHTGEQPISTITSLGSTLTGLGQDIDERLPVVPEVSIPTSDQGPIYVPGKGTMEWTGSAYTPTGGGAKGGGSNRAFYSNDKVVTENMTLTSDQNWMSAGPLTIAEGVIVTVEPGATWSVV